MSLLRNIASGRRSLLEKKRAAGELDEQLYGFLAMAAEEKTKQGMTPKEALRAVRLERGTLEATKEIIHSAGWAFPFGDVLARLLLRFARTEEIARIRSSCGADPGVGYWRQYCGF